MRRRAVIALALGALGLSAPVAGTQSSGGLVLEPSAVRLLTPAAEPEDREAVFVARQGERYRFEVGYQVGGADRIGTGHVFVFENAVTGARLEVRSRSFPPEAPGAYNESSDLTIPADWAPGVYRFRWTLNARASRMTSVSEQGARVFLVGPPA